jgi:hypothetical protein
MPNGRGSQPGERRGGRQPGSKNIATREQESMISRAIGELSRPLGKDVLAEAMMKFPGPVAVTPGGSARGTSERCWRASRKNRNRIQEEHFSEAI